MGSHYRRVVCILVSLSLFLTFVGCSHRVDESVSVSEEMKALRDSFTDRSLTAKYGGVDEDELKDELDKFGNKFKKSEKKSRIEISWNASDLGDNEELIDSFVFRYRIPVKVSGGKSYMLWTTVAAPSAGKVYTDYKFEQNTPIAIDVYAVRKDGKGPHRVLDSDFVNTVTDTIDLFDEEDKKLWYLRHINATTLLSPGSNILGNYGYDYRKSGKEFNPDALVPQGWLDMISFCAAHIDNGRAVYVRDVTECDKKDEVITQDYVQKYVSSTSSSKNVDFSRIYSGDFGTGALGKKIIDANQKTVPASNDPAYYIMDGEQKKYSVTVPKKESKVSAYSDPEQEAIKAGMMLLSSALTSFVKMLGFGDSDSDSSTVTDMGSSVIGYISDYKYLTEEWLDPNYDIPKLEPFLLDSFKNDVRDPSFPPDKLFDRYGTHMPFLITKGGRLLMTYKYEDHNGSDYNTTKKNISEVFSKNVNTEKEDTTSEVGKNATMEIHAWGGAGVGSVATDFKTYQTIRTEWGKTVASNPVVVNLPGLFQDAGPAYKDKQMNKNCGIWNFALDPDRQKEIFEAFMSYVTEANYEDLNFVYSRPKYLQDIVLIKISPEDFKNGIMPNPITYSVVSAQVANKLYDTNEIWAEDPFTGSLLYDDEGNVGKYVTYTRVLSDIENGNEPISFGDNVYAFAVYTCNPGDALHGFAVTEADTDDSSFETHAQLLVNKYSFPQKGDSNSNAYHTVFNSKDKKVYVCDRNNRPLAEWYMCDCKVAAKEDANAVESEAGNTENSDEPEPNEQEQPVVKKYDDACSGKYRIWKSRQVASAYISSASDKYPISDLNLCIKEGSEKSGWSLLMGKDNKGVVKLNGIELSLCREKLI